MRQAIFLDKDGTLINDIPYNIDPSLIKFREGVIEGLKSLQEYYSLIIITNQSGIARGLFTEQELQDSLNYLVQALKEKDVHITGYYFCPHHPQGSMEKYSIHCSCRKPKPGMILRAAQDFSLNLSHSWMIGDSEVDSEAGSAAGCRTILIREIHHNNSQVLSSSSAKIVSNFSAAVTIVRT